MVKKVAGTILKELHHQDKEISLLFVDDRQITTLNEQYFKRSRPTNVISFPMAQGEFSEISPQLFGDVVISVETAMREARKSGLRFEEEVTRLLIHGILHLMGYDHIGRGRQEMQGVQDRLFDRLRPIRDTQPKDTRSKP
ncbi:MAG: rRNA maturation RNase YbeY [Proteobacteria bacterium]|nr:rRNA maturation RNase YbeY [Pseudomonadota bacterium]